MDVSCEYTFYQVEELSSYYTFWFGHKQNSYCFFSLKTIMWFFSFCIWCVLFINLILWSLHFGKPRDHRGLFTFLNSACSYFVKNTSVYAHKQISVACSGDDSMWKWHSSNTSQMSKLQGCTAFVLGNMYIKD